MESQNDVVKVVAWGHYDYDRERELQKQNLPQEQDDGSNCTPRQHQLMEMAVVDELIRKQYRFSGEAHQSHPFGTPILDVNGKRVYFTASWRAWGGIMAEAMTIVDNENYNYMDFYMSGFLGVNDDKNKPKYPEVGIDIDENGNCID